MPQAIFFDLDETLIRHSTPVMEQLQTVCQQYLADLSEAHWNVFHEHLLVNVGLLWRDIGQYQGRCEAMFIEIFRDSLAKVKHDTGLAETMIEAFLVSVVDSTGPAEGAHEVLDQLAAAGVATGVITNGFAFLQKRKAHAHGIAERVRVVMTSEDASVHKPDAHIFHQAIRQLGIAVDDGWHVGDNLDKDIAGAAGAGLRGVLYDPDRLLADAAMPGPTPWRVIHRLTEVTELIRGIS